LKTFFRDLFWVFVSCVLWAAAFHPVDAWPLAWVALVPAFVRTATPAEGKRRLGLAWVIAQYFLHAALMSWTAVIAWPLAFLVPLLGIPFSWLTGFLLARGVVRLGLPVFFVGPLVIVLVEVLRDQALTGLSWASIGYSQWRWLDLVQLASAGRVHLVSLVVLLASGAIATAIVRWRGRRPAAARLAPLALGAALVGAAWLAGRAIRPAAFEEGPLAAGLQPNISQAERLKDHREAWLRSVRIHKELIDQVRSLPLDLLVWSETSFWPAYEPDNTLARRLDGLVPAVKPGEKIAMRDLVLPGRDQVTVLGLVRAKKLAREEIGGPRDDDADGFDETNVAWIVRGGAPTDVVYEKRGLAPFGEYVPVPRGFPGRDFVKSMIERLARIKPDLNFGEAGVLFDAGSPGGVRKGGLTICFEIVFPWYYRESARMGGDFHVNISNDAWFDGSCELALVDVAAIFRAVETGRALFRVSNSGISTLIGPDGRRLAVVEGEAGRRTQVRGAFHGRIPIWRGRTGYVLLGDLPWVLPATALILAFLVGRIRMKRDLPGLSVR
jgi:apolipoprotein N-acyltransferase